MSLARSGRLLIGYGQGLYKLYGIGAEAVPSVSTLSTWQDAGWSADGIPAMRLLDGTDHLGREFLIFGDRSSAVSVFQLSLDGSQVDTPIRLPVAGEHLFIHWYTDLS